MEDDMYIKKVPRWSNVNKIEGLWGFVTGVVGRYKWSCKLKPPVNVRSIKIWWGYWIFIIAAYSQMSSLRASVRPHWRVSNRVLPWIFGKKLWNLQVGWMVGEVKVWKSHCSWCNNMKWTKKWLKCDAEYCCFHQLLQYHITHPIKTHHPSPFIFQKSIQVLPYWSLPVPWVLLVHGLMVFSSFIVDLQLMHRHFVLPWRSVRSNGGARGQQSLGRKQVG